MTESVEPEDVAADSAEVVDHDDVLDLIIDTFAGKDDNGEGSIGMTLLVGGAIVRGDVCSLREWGRSLRGASGNEMGVGFAEGVADEFEGRKASDKRRPGFIHMKNVTIQAGGESSAHRSWRGRLSDVSGWSFGN